MEVSKEYNPNLVALACATQYVNWYPGRLKNIKDTDKIRGDLALELISSAQEHRVRVIFADAGSSRQFLTAASRFPNVTVLANLAPLRGEQKRTAFITASELPQIEVIVNTEPEKVDLINHIPQIVKPILDGGGNIILPSREPNLFREDYPPYLYDSEILVNRRINRILQMCGLQPENVNFDWFFGPRVVKNDPATLGWFLEKYELPNGYAPSFGIRRFLNPEQGSNVQFFGVYKGLYMASLFPDRYRVSDVEIPFHYPLLQRQNEEEADLLNDHISKRNLQRYQFWADLIQFVRFLQNSPRNHLIKTG